VFVADKTLSGPQGDGTLPVCPPSYEEATAGSSPSHSYGYQGNGEMLTEFTWQDKNIRRIFIRKVPLRDVRTFTLTLVSSFHYSEPVKTYIQANPGWHWASYVVFCVTFISLSCCATLRWVLRSLHSGRGESSSASYYNTRSVMVTLGITALVCLSVTVFSFQTKVGLDYTYLKPSLITNGISSSALQVPWLHAIYAVLGAIVFTMFLVFDTQILLGNKRSTISPEDYIFATLSLYLDIIYIFSFFLQLFGMDRN
uniref:Protein lifeguard 2 n=1 Tax=Paramormyrops kingsleyae TaxID=1676925 RepID=A0A3B3RXX8_9TELE